MLVSGSVYIHKTCFVEGGFMLANASPPFTSLCLGSQHTIYHPLLHFRISPGHSRHDLSPHCTSSCCSYTPGNYLGTAASDWRLKGSEDAPHSFKETPCFSDKKITTGLTKKVQTQECHRKLIIHPCLLRVQTDLGKDLPKESCSL